MEHSEERDSTEYNRTRVLHELNIMDSAPDMCFDQLAFLASKLCQTPIALISFINSRRQWFKASYGLHPNEFPKFVTACNKTVIGGNFYEIKNADDAACPYRQFMLESGFRYYAGIPITIDESFHVGSLCVIDYEPRELSSDQIQSLRAISDQITGLLEIRRKYNENLKRLQELGEFSYKKDKLLQEVFYKSRMKSIAEVASGLAFKVRPLALNISTISKELLDEVDQGKVIHEAGEKILEVFDSLDLFVEAEKEKSMRPVEMKGLLQEVISILEYRTQALGMKIDLITADLEYFFVGNSSQLKEAFYQVLMNAIDAVEKQEKREIRVFLDEENHKITIRFTDSGQGVPDNVAPFIFQPFFTTKGSVALGAGLCLVENLVHLHSGDIHLEKSYGPTTFTITFPKH